MQEQWTQWKPLNTLSKKYYIKSLADNFGDGFKIILADAEEKTTDVLIHFPNSVNAYRRTDETFIVLSLDYLNKVYGGEFYADWTFFTVTNSNYLKWIGEQSRGIAEPPYYNFVHYCIITDEEILDIACTYEPTVTFED